MLVKIVNTERTGILMVSTLRCPIFLAAMVTGWTRKLGELFTDWPAGLHL